MILGFVLVPKLTAPVVPESNVSVLLVVVLIVNAPELVIAVGAMLSVAAPPVFPTARVLAALLNKVVSRLLPNAIPFAAVVALASLEANHNVCVSAVSTAIP
jgi:hypothetical protein